MRFTSVCTTAALLVCIKEAVRELQRSPGRCWFVSLMKKGVLISTTEHLLSAFIGMGVDNAIIELDNLELPILDGSALPFVEMITRAGVRQQRRLL